ADGDDHGHDQEDEHTAAKTPTSPATTSLAAPTTAASTPSPQIKLSDAQLKAANIEVQAAGPATLRSASPFQGEIRFNEDRTAHVVPRMAGVVESVSAQLGQQVRKGQVLAVIDSSALADQRSELLTAQQRQIAARSVHEREKKLWDDRISAEQDYLQARSALLEADIAVRNASQKLAAVGAKASSANLSQFEIRAPFDGMVVEKHLTLGEAVKDDAAVFTLSDLRTVSAEFVVAPQDLARVRVGQKATVSSTAFASTATGTVSYVGSLLGQQTRTALARVTVANPELSWRPGLFVTVSVAGDETQASVAVNADAVQTVDNQTVVFAQVPGGFVTRPVRIGRNDGKTAEVTAGLKAGDRIAASNTFVLKSELGKSSATHTH
ncbi:MAG: czcB2, partial [Rhizobacter sp.]|nr:czcB2 [Rhizobacter sp.]